MHKRNIAQTNQVEAVDKKSKRGSSDLVGTSSVVNIPEIFADPTLDITFKMLFGTDRNKDILISLLNSLLGFTGAKEIIEVEINSNELPVSFFSKDKGESGITSAIDILCTNRGKQKIAIEMQGQKTKYFLPREQEYMAKLISLQVREGEGKLYHEKVLETYIIVIGKVNIFVGDTSLRDQTLFELDVQPVVLQTNQVIPGNKMFWKFYELPKFQDSESYRGISKGSPLKEQWLEFLVDCSKQEHEPERDEIIKRGYEIMKVATWSADQQVLYWKQKANEQDALETVELSKQEAFDQGVEQGIVKGMAKGVEQGKMEAQIKMLPGLKKFILKGTSHEDNVEFFPLFSDEQISRFEEYVGQHPDCLVSELVQLLGEGSL